MDSIRNGLRSIARKKLRSMLTIFGIAIGVLSVSLISMIGEVGKAQINAELNSMGISGLCVRSTEEKAAFTSRELAAVQENEHVSQATPLMTSYASISSRGMQAKAVLWGVDSNAEEIVSLKLLHGRMIRSGEVAARAQVCVVDESFAQLFYRRSNIVGKTIRILIDGRYEPFQVVGVVASGGNLLQGLMGDVVPSFLYAPFTTLGQLSHQEEFSQIVAKLKPDSDETAAASSIISCLSQERDSVQVENLNQQKDRLNGVLNLVTLILSVIGGISLVVAGLSIMTVMLVTVHERTREIGIKKSIGASKGVILAEFLTEALLLSLLGCGIGIAAALLLGAAGCGALGIPLEVNPSALLFCGGFSVGMGTLFGVYPAVQAARMKPVDALRCE